MLLNYQSFKWMSAIWIFSWIHWLKQSIRTLFTLKTCYPYHWHSREKVSSPKDSRRYPLISSQNGTSIKHRNRTFIPFMKLISDKACMRLCQHLQTHKCTNILIHVSLLLNLIKKRAFLYEKDSHKGGRPFWNIIWLYHICELYINTTCRSQVSVSFVIYAMCCEHKPVCH